MAVAYTPGLKVTRFVRHQTRRLLSIAGDVLVKVGQKVDAKDVVAQTFMPGDVTPINLSNLLSVPPGEVSECLLVKEGEAIEVGQPLARTKGIFGVFKNEYKSKSAGTLESVSKVTGQLIVRGEPLAVRVLAFLAGEVVEVIPSQGVVIEADVTFIQGIFGIGGEAYGPLKMACADPKQELTADLLTPEMKGQIVIGGARMTGDAVRKAIKLGISAVISGGMDDQDLKEILGYDLGVAVTGSEQVGTTVIITEGFGEIAMAERTFGLFKSREGDAAAVNGATQIRAGVMRPEILIPLSDEERNQETEPAHADGALGVGSPVRIIRDPYFGLIGKVSGLPSETRVLG
jgi:biotin carboxyl carrier protein